MRVLVTGGAGFVGSHLVDALIDEGHDARVVDMLLESAHHARPSYLNPAAEYCWGDITDPSVARDVVAGIDAVSHQAAMVGLGADFGDIVAYTQHNSMGTATLLQALHDCGFVGPFVLASSMVVYGEGAYRCPAHGVVRPGRRTRAALDGGDFEPPCPVCGAPLDAEAVSEDASVDPRNVYAATKLHQEHLCAAFADARPDVTLGVLRYHNVYGPRMPRDTPYAGVASIFRSALERGEAPMVFEDGQQRRDFVHVHDVADANVLALTTPGFRGTCNVASGEPHNVLDMANGLADAAGSGAPRPRVVGGGRVGDVRHVFASPRRAAEQLGFEARVRFSDGLREFAGAPLR